MFKFTKHIKENYNFNIDHYTEDIDDTDIYNTKQSVSATLKKNKKLYKYEYLVNHVWKDNPPVKVGDILYDNFTRDEDGRLLTLGDNSAKPIGVCVILPAFLPDGEMRFMLIGTNMNGYITGYSGNMYTYNLPSYMYAITDKDTLDTTPIFLSDNFGVEDSGTKYGRHPYLHDSVSMTISYPYIDNNKFNKLWLSKDSVLCDLLGWKNTKILSQEISDHKSAALKCNLYNTNSTYSGEWYLPAIGELGIMYAKWKTIRNIVNNISKTKLREETEIWSSSLRNDATFWVLYTLFGTCSYDLKYISNLITPFFHIELSPSYLINNLMNETYNFNIDNIEDLDNSDTIYNTVKKISKDSLLKAKLDFLKKNPPIKVGDILYSNFERDKDGHLVTLGDENGTPIGVCCILPYFLPDQEIRFMAINTLSRQTYGLIYDKLLNIDKVKALCYTNNIPLFVTSFNLEENPTLNPYIDKNRFDTKFLEPSLLGLADLLGWKNTYQLAKYLNKGCAVSCYNYKTPGTKYNEWYLPSIGELWIMYAKYDILKQYLPSCTIASSTVFKLYGLYNLRYHTLDLTNGYCVFEEPIKQSKVLPFFHIKYTENI